MVSCVWSLLTVPSLMIIYVSGCHGEICTQTVYYLLVSHVLFPTELRLYYIEWRNSAQPAMGTAGQWRTCCWLVELHFPPVFRWICFVCVCTSKCVCLCSSVCQSLHHCSCWYVDRGESSKMADDPMYKLEHGIKDQKKAKEDQPRLTHIEVMLCYCVSWGGYSSRFNGLIRTCSW